MAWSVGQRDDPARVVAVDQLQHLHLLDRLLALLDTGAVLPPFPFVAVRGTYSESHFVSFDLETDAGAAEGATSPLGLLGSLLLDLLEPETVHSSFVFNMSIPTI